MSQISTLSVISSGRMPATLQLGVLLAIFLIILSGCQSAFSPKHVELSPSSSVLGVDVSFPVAWAPDPPLGGVYFIKELPGGGLQEASRVIPADWIRKTRAYLLNPEPGTYYVVAVIWSQQNLPQSSSVSVGGGVSVGVSTGGGSHEHAIILPEEMIQQTRTTIALSGMEFMGALRIRSGGRINAKTEFQDDLQRHFAEVIRPSAVQATGWFAERMTMTRMVDLEKSSATDTASDLEKFLRDTAGDFVNSPRSQIGPGSDPSNSDSDGDGLSDVSEINVHMTDPRNPDSDADGLTDGAEINIHGTDPRDQDSDNDGLKDDEEVTDYLTDPLNRDTDEDGFSDGEEVLAGSDPKVE